MTWSPETLATAATFEFQRWPSLSPASIIQLSYGVITDLFINIPFKSPMYLSAYVTYATSLFFFLLWGVGTPWNLSHSTSTVLQIKTERTGGGSGHLAVMQPDVSSDTSWCFDGYVESYRSKEQAAPLGAPNLLQLCYSSTGREYLFHKMFPFTSLFWGSSESQQVLFFLTYTHPYYNQSLILVLKVECFIKCS